jgi:spore coat protein H
MWKFSLIFRVGSIFLASAIVLGCEYREEKNDFGLDILVEMKMTSEEMSIIDTGAYTKTPVNIPVWINGEKFLGKVSYAGATQVDSLKRSFEVILSSSFNERQVYRLSAMNGDLSTLRAMTVFHAFSTAGFLVPEIKPAAVWMNGEYAGLFLLMSVYDQAYFDRRKIAPVQLYQAENGIGDLSADTSLKRAFSVKLGSAGKADLARTTALIAANPTMENCDALEKIVNVDNVMKYMAISALLGNRDGIDNNYFLLRTASDSRLQVLPWDLDLTLYEQYSPTDGSIFVENALFYRFFSDNTCGRSYGDVYTDIQSQLKAADLENFSREYAELIRDAFEADWFLSGGKRTLDEHLAEISTFLNQTLGY